MRTSHHYDEVLLLDSIGLLSFVSAGGSIFEVLDCSSKIDVRNGSIFSNVNFEQASASALVFTDYGVL